MELQVTKEIYQLLCERDEIFISLGQRFGLIHQQLDDDIFRSITYSIVGQMLSNKAAAVIWARICGQVQIIDPESFVKLGEEKLRSCGISKNKASYILAFSKSVLNKEINLDSIRNLETNEVITKLIKMKGVGQWTAEMIAMFTLGRPNVWSFGDVALKSGIMKAKNYKTLSKKRFDSLKKRYSPYCSYAALYFYRLNDYKGD